MKNTDPARNALNGKISSIRTISEFVSADSPTAKISGTLLMNIILVLCSCAAIGGSLILPQGPPTWDGAEHSLYGLKIYFAFQNHDWHEFRTVTASQNLWPFLHSWVLAAMFLMTGPSFLSARLVSLFLFAAVACLTAVLARRLVSPHAQNPASWIAVLLVVTSPMMMLYAAQPMLEIPGAFLTLAVLLCAAAPGYKWKSFAGILLAVTLFTKYIYALLLIITFCTDFLIRTSFGLRSSPDKKKSLRQAVSEPFLLLGPVFAGALAWFLRPDARAGFHAAFHNPSTILSIVSPLNLMTYPLLLLLYFFATPLLGILAGWSFFRRRKTVNPTMQRMAVIYILITLCILTIYSYKLTRAIFTAAPVLFALSAANISSIISKTPRSRWAVLIAAVLLIHLPSAFIPGIMQGYHPAMRQEAGHMLNFDKNLPAALEEVAEAASDEEPVGIIGDFHAVSAPLVQWSFLLEGKGKKAYPLLNWSKPVDRIDLHRLMKNSKTPVAFVIRVVPGSRYDDEDYRKNYAWMTENLILQENQPGLSGFFTQQYDRALHFELWRYAPPGL